MTFRTVAGLVRKRLPRATGGLGQRSARGSLTSMRGRASAAVRPPPEGCMDRS